VSNTNVSEILICEEANNLEHVHNEDQEMNDLQLDKIPWQAGEHHQLFPCEQFVNLEDLDLRFNMIKALKQLNFPNLKKLFLSGNFFSI
jgi:hypothetical protein